MNQPILLAVVMGLWQKAGGAWLGLRSVIAQLQSETKGFEPPCKLDVFGYEYDNKNQLFELAAKTQAYEKIVFIGHSHGGHEAFLVAAGHYGPVNKIHDLILLDPKPEGLAWFSRSFKYPIPESVTIPKSFYNDDDFPGGRPFELEAFSKKLLIRHDEFCMNPTVHAYIRQQVIALAKG